LSKDVINVNEMLLQPDAKYWERKSNPGRRD